jgi:YHS domain-containing protein
MERTLIKSAVAGVLLLGMTTVAMAGEYDNMCTYGLSQGKQVSTDCSVSASLTGKTYCFSSADAMAKFMQDYKANLSKADDYYKSIQG